MRIFGWGLHFTDDFDGDTLTIFFGEPNFDLGIISRTDYLAQNDAVLLQYGLLWLGLVILCWGRDSLGLTWFIVERKHFLFLASTGTLIGGKILRGTTTNLKLCCCHEDVYKEMTMSLTQITLSLGRCRHLKWSQNNVVIFKTAPGCYRISQLLLSCKNQSIIDKIYFRIFMLRDYKNEILK